MITVRYLAGRDIETSEEVRTLRREASKEQALTHLTRDFEHWDTYLLHVQGETCRDNRLVIEQSTMSGDWMLAIYEGPPAEIRPLFVIARLYCRATENGTSKERAWWESSALFYALDYRPTHGGFTESASV